MALIHSDSFDLMPEKPGVNTTEVTSIGNWTGFATSIGGFPSTSINYSRLSRGKGCLLYGGVLRAVTLTTVHSRDTTYWAGSTRSYGVFNATTTQWFSVYFYEGGTTVQIEVRWCQDGAIRVYRGGTVLIATFTSATDSQTWEHWQVKVVIASGTSGSVRLRKNGDSVDTFAATGLNTLATSTATTDGIGIECGNTIGAYVDDHILWDDDPSGEPNNWIGDIRAYPLYANAAGSATNYTPYAAPVVKNDTTSTWTLATGTTRFFKIIGDFDGVMNSVAINLTASLTGKVNAALYTSNGANLPDTLLATATEVTNPSAGSVTLTFSSPPSVTRGTGYWIGIASDASITVYTDTVSPAISLSTAYASAFPATVTGTTSGYAFNAIKATITYTPTNYGAINDLSLDQDLSYVYSSVVGTNDYYNFDNLPYTPSYVLMLVVKSVAKKSDTNPRSIRNNLKSSTTVYNGADYNLSTTYRTVETPLFTDPATGLPWTKSGVDAVQAGTEVTV